MKLTVLEAYDHDLYKDMARIHVSHRSGVKRNGLARITVAGCKSEVLAVRGMEPEKRDFVRLDHEVRDRLNVKLDQQYDFDVRRASAFDHLRWALGSSEPALRVATWIAIWSFVLGVLGLIIGILPLLPFCRTLP